MENDVEEMGSDVEESESRRKFLKTAGKFAVYTPPALMVMNKASAKKMAKSGGYSGEGPKRKKGKRKTKRKTKRKVAKRKTKR